MTSSPGLSKWELDRRPTDIIVIGSQVVYGSVGTNASSTVYTEAGLRAAVAPTILLSSLPHYDSVHTSALPAAWLHDALTDITTLGVLDDAKYITTGYFASPDQVEAVAQWLKVVLAEKPHLDLIVDPTLGDSDVGFYTDPAVADALAKHLIPLATGLTPNRFELETLGVEPAELFTGNCEWIILTGGAEEPVTNQIYTPEKTVSFEAERVDTAAKGTGDLFTAHLVTALNAGENIFDATQTAAHRVIERLKYSQRQ